MGQLEGIMEHFKIFLQGQRCSRQLLLVRFNMLGQLSWRVNKLESLAALQACQKPLVVLGILSHPCIAVVDINSCYVLIGKARKDHKPLR